MTRTLASYLALLALLVPFTVFADTQGLELAPAIFEDKVDPGTVHDFTLNVTNVSDVEKTFYLLARDIRSVSESGQPQFAVEGEPTPYNISAWITIERESIVLPPGGTVPVNFSIRVPADATPGSHFGGIFLEALPPKLRTTGTGVGISVGSLINMQISGDVIEDARLRSFSTGKLIYTELPATFEVRIENLGNSLVRPTGFVEVINMFGKQVANLRLNESANGVFPGTERPFSVVWDQEDLAFGRYQAVASVAYGGDVRKTISATGSFWVLPMVPLMYFFGGILAFILVLYFGVRTYIRGQLKRMGIKGGERTYDARYGRKMSQTTSIVVTLFIFCVIFLLALLVLFA